MLYKIIILFMALNVSTLVIGMIEENPSKKKLFLVEFDEDEIKVINADCREVFEEFQETHKDLNSIVDSITSPKAIIEYQSNATANPYCLSFCSALKKSAYLAFIIETKPDLRESLGSPRLYIKKCLCFMHNVEQTIFEKMKEKNIEKLFYSTIDMQILKDILKLKVDIPDIADFRKYYSNIEIGTFALRTEVGLSNTSNGNWEKDFISKHYQLVDKVKPWVEVAEQKIKLLQQKGEESVKNNAYTEIINYSNLKDKLHFRIEFFKDQLQKIESSFKLDFSVCEWLKNLEKYRDKIELNNANNK